MAGRVVRLGLRRHRARAWLATRRPLRDPALRERVQRLAPRGVRVRDEKGWREGLGKISVAAREFQPVLRPRVIGPPRDRTFSIEGNAGCPYGARSFNWREPRKDKKTLWGGRPIIMDYPTRERGVVEKCLFCYELIEKAGVPESGHELQDKQIPYCVKAAPKGAIVFGNLKDSNSRIRKVLRDNQTIVRKPEAGTNPSVFYLI